MKVDDSYYFSIPFDCEIQDDDGDWTTLSTSMDVDLEWDDYDEGYKVSFECPDEDVIVESGGSLVECYNTAVHEELLSLLSAEGVSVGDIVSGGVAF